MEFYRGDFPVGHPSFAEGSQAVTQPACAPAEISAPKIVYSKEDDDAIDEFHRRTGSSCYVNLQIELVLIFCNTLVQTSWHSVREPSLAESLPLFVTHFIDLFQIGTCAMKPRERGGVVDARLNVYGVQNLKIAGKYLNHSFGKNLFKI